MHIHKTTSISGTVFYCLFENDETPVELVRSYAIALTQKSRYSPRTVPQYIKDLKYFCESLRREPSYEKLKVDDALKIIESQFVEDWLAQLAKKGSNAYTIRRLDAVLRGFFQWMTTEEGGWVRSNENNPYSDGKYKTLSPQRPTIKCMTYQEVSNFILHGFEDESERCLIHFMYETGVRVSEVTGILKSDLPLLENYPDNLRYFPIPIRESKGHGGIIIKRFGIISRPMIERVLSLHNNSKVYQQRSSLYSLINQPMFLDTIGNPISTHSIQRKFYLASKKLLEKRIIQEPIYPHMLRRATAFSISKSEHRLNSFEKLVLYQQVLVYASIRSIRFYTAAPAAVIAKSQQSRDENGLSDRYQEAEYIIKQTV